MNAHIERDGTLVLSSGVKTEQYALIKWFESANTSPSHVQMKVELGNLTLGPQPVLLEVVLKDPEFEGGL